MSRCHRQLSRLRLQQSGVSLEEILHLLDSVQGLRIMTFVQVERICPILLDLGQEIVCCTYPTCWQEIVEKSDRFLVALTGKVLVRYIPLCQQGFSTEVSTEGGV
jgi:hypothetical protein